MFNEIILFIKLFLLVAIPIALWLLGVLILINQ
jgi:hypothetical protein